MAASIASRALSRILDEGGEKKERVLALGLHRSQLWRYATGRGKPDADQVAKLAQATDGEVAADGWLDDEAIPDTERPAT
jgi:transcriptional regulator with XRE-family HTH domain